MNDRMFWQVHDAGCPTCLSSDIRSDPGKPNGGWHRCWTCGSLWGTDGTDILKSHPEMILDPHELDRG